ncbi:hypothetical protein M758_6G139600 [Ceratodon purpureus]|nr:hypothetical protein M758_6G139600 [Ceratodon purpureus]
MCMSWRKGLRTRRTHIRDWPRGRFWRSHKTTSSKFSPDSKSPPGREESRRMIPSRLSPLMLHLPVRFSQKRVAAHQLFPGCIGQQTNNPPQSITSIPKLHLPHPTQLPTSKQLLLMIHPPQSPSSLTIRASQTGQTSSTPVATAPCTCSTCACNSNHHLPSFMSPEGVDASSCACSGVAAYHRGRWGTANVWGMQP